MTNSVIHTFGPGSLESIYLKMWTAKLIKGVKAIVTTFPDIPDARKIKFTVQGNYTIHCGAGNEHTVEIDVTDSIWDVEDNSYVNDIIHARAGDEDAQWRLAHTLIGWELEDWYDPCEG